MIVPLDQITNDFKTNNNLKKDVKCNKKFAIAFNTDIINEISLHDLGELNDECIFCRALFFKGQNKRCCKRGRLAKLLYSKLIKSEENIPDLIKDLYTGRHMYSSIFLIYLRLLNSIFSLTSLGVSKSLTRKNAIQVKSDLGK